MRAVHLLPAVLSAVAGGIKTEGDGDLATSSVFGSANLFRSGGVLEIRGPDGFAAGQLVRYLDFEDVSIELDDLGAPSGVYTLSFVSESGRQFDAEVELDATLALPLPVVEFEVVGGSPTTLEAAWDCAGADRARPCHGPVFAMDGAFVATTGDSTRAYFDQAVFTVTAHRDPLDSESDVPRDRQFAKAELGSVWGD